MFVNDHQVAQGRIENTHGYSISVDEGADVGEDRETPVVEDYGVPAPHSFDGKIVNLTIELVKMEQAGPVQMEKMNQTNLKRALAE